eukprot:jgi/Psemu1/15448/gm1.15448_g
MKSTKTSQSTSIDRSYQLPPPRKKPKAQESQKSKSPITSFRCICNWGNYTYQGMEIPVREFMFNQFQTHLEDGHPWKDQLIKFTTGTTVKPLAFKAAVFEIFKVSAVQKSFRLAHHHFLPTLLTNPPGQRTQLLTAQEVHALDNNLVSPEKGYATSKYTVYSLLRNHPMVSFTAQMVEMYKKKYAGSPLLPKKWVLGRAESFSSPQKSRTSDLNAVTSKRPLLPVKRLMPLELLDKKQSGVKTRGKCYKSIESIYAGLISHYKQAQTLEEFQAAEFVQRAMNDISFQARRNSVYPTAFELEKNTILHACMSYPVPNEQYFHFGVMLMKKVSASVDQEKLGNDPDATANAKDDILKNDELLEVFLDCSKGNVYLGKLSEKKKIFAELVDKVINARFSEEIRAYREEHTARGTKYKGTNLTMREEIDVIGSRKRASSNSDAGRSIEERKEE